jgi:hypothetical protein
MSYHAGGSLHDMSSYVAVSGTPQNDTCSVYGLTPQEVRYLKVGVQVVSVADTDPAFFVNADPDSDPAFFVIRIRIRIEIQIRIQIHGCDE